MRLNTPLISAFAFVLTFATLSGCSGNGSPLGFLIGSKSKTPEHTARETTDTQQSPPRDEQVASSEAGLRNAGVASRTRTPRFRQKPRPPVQGQSSFIGLYGEAVTYQPTALHQQPTPQRNQYQPPTADPTPDRDPAPHGRPNLSQVTFIEEGGCFDPAIDPTGEVLAFASTMHQERANIYLKAVNGSTITQLTSDPADDIMPAFSPDGSRIAFASNRSGSWNIYTVSINGGPPTQVTDDVDHQIHPTWSPDGNHVAYGRYSNTSGRWEIWTVDIANPGVRTFLDYGLFPQWSPVAAETAGAGEQSSMRAAAGEGGTRSKILFQRPRQRGSRYHGVWTIDYVAGEAKHPTEIVSAGNAATINPSWSPNGRFITFVSVMDPDGTSGERPNRSDIWLIGVDGTNRVKLTDGEHANFQPIWSVDGRVYFVSDRSGIDNIWSVSAEAMEEQSRESAADIAGVEPGSERPSGN